MKKKADKLQKSKLNLMIMTIFSVALSSSVKPTRSEFVTIHLPRKVMECKVITSAVDRLTLSDSQTTVIISAVIKAGNGNFDDFDIIYAHQSHDHQCRYQKTTRTRGDGT